MKLLWAGLTPLQGQSLMDLIDREVEEVRRTQPECETREAYCKSLHSAFAAIATAGTEEVHILKTEVHNLRNLLQGAQLYKASKVQKDG